MESFNYYVVAKCKASKYEPEYEKVVAAFVYLTSAEDFLNTFSLEQREKLEIRALERK